MLYRKSKLCQQPFPIFLKCLISFFILSSLFWKTDLFTADSFYFFLSIHYGYWSFTVYLSSRLIVYPCSSKQYNVRFLKFTLIIVIKWVKNTILDKKDTIFDLMCFHILWSHYLQMSYPDYFLYNCVEYSTLCRLFLLFLP